MRHLGHRAISTTMMFAPGDSLGRDFVLVAGAATLDTTSVIARAPSRSYAAPGKLMGYADRRMRNVGVALDSTILTRENYLRLSDIIRTHVPVLWTR